MTPSIGGATPALGSLGGATSGSIAGAPSTSGIASGAGSGAGSIGATASGAAGGATSTLGNIGAGATSAASNAAGGLGNTGNALTIPDPTGQVPLSLGLSVQPERYIFGLSLPIGFGVPPSAAAPPGAGSGISNATSGASRSPNPGGRPPASAPNQGRRSGAPPLGEQRFIPDEVMARLPSDVSPQALEAFARRHNLTRLQSLPIGLSGTTLHRWRFSGGRSVGDVVRALENDATVLAAQPNYVFTLADQVGRRAEFEADQYALEKLHLPQAHRFATGRRILVAVIDSGIDESHPEIAGMVAERFDALEGSEPPHIHGTAMAGAIIAHAKLRGVAPSARILAVRAFGVGTNQSGTTVSILRGIDWAIAHHARVINMSFAGPYDPEVARGLATARHSGVVLVAAAGNAGPKSPPQFPAADPNVIAVTATDADDQLFPMATRGHHVAVAAPGVDILTPAPGGAYHMNTGTSVAAAQISGVAALLLERAPTLTPEIVQNVLLSSATDLGPRGRDDQYGAGLADAYRAIQSLNAFAPRHGPATASARQ